MRVENGLNSTGVGRYKEKHRKIITESYFRSKGLDHRPRGFWTGMVEGSKDGPTRNYSTVSSVWCLRKVNGRTWTDKKVDYGNVCHRGAEEKGWREDWEPKIRKGRGKVNKTTKREKGGISRREKIDTSERSTTVSRSREIFCRYVIIESDNKGTIEGEQGIQSSRCSERDPTEEIKKSWLQTFLEVKRSQGCEWELYCVTQY